MTNDEYMDSLDTFIDSILADNKDFLEYNFKNAFSPGDDDADIILKAVFVATRVSCHISCKMVLAELIGLGILDPADLPSDYRSSWKHPSTSTFHVIDGGLSDQKDP